MSRYVLLVASAKKIEDLGVIAPGQETRLRNTGMLGEKIIRPEYRPLVWVILETC